MRISDGLVTQNSGFQYSGEILRRLISFVTSPKKFEFLGTRLITKMCITNAYVYELSSAIGLSSYFKTEIEIYARKNATHSYFIPSPFPLCVGFLKFFFPPEGSLRASSIEKNVKKTPLILALLQTVHRAISLHYTFFPILSSSSLLLF